MFTPDKRAPIQVFRPRSITEREAMAFTENVRNLLELLVNVRNCLQMFERPRYSKEGAGPEALSEYRDVPQQKIAPFGNSRLRKSQEKFANKTAPSQLITRRSTAVPLSLTFSRLVVSIETRLQVAFHLTTFVDSTLAGLKTLSLNSLLKAL